MSSSDRLSRLAVFGGQPRATSPLHVGRPSLGNSEDVVRRVREALDRRWLSNDGPLVMELEERIAKHLGVQHCVAVSSATAGLSMLARALGLTGDVVVPAFTFVATAHALTWVGLQPVFCDVDRKTHQLDASLVERAVTPTTSGILAAHTWGRPADTDALAAAAEDLGLALIYDAAPAFGATRRRRAVGTFGAAEVISLHATKAVNAGEGGAVLTDDAELARALRSLRSFGFVDNDHVAGLGTNAKMPELSAALGLSSIDAYHRTVATNEQHFRLYQRLLEGLPGVTLLPYEDGELANYNNVVVEVDAASTGISRDLLLQVLTAENVLARRYFYPGCHRMEPYRSRPSTHDFPVTDELAGCVLSLPTGNSLEAAQVELVCELLNEVVTQGREITRRAGALRLPALFDAGSGD